MTCPRPHSAAGPGSLPCAPTGSLQAGGERGSDLDVVRCVTRRGQQQPRCLGFFISQQHSPEGREAGSQRDPQGFPAWPPPGPPKSPAPHTPAPRRPMSMHHAVSPGTPSQGHRPGRACPPPPSPPPGLRGRDSGSGCADCRRALRMRSGRSCFRVTRLPAVGVAPEQGPRGRVVAYIHGDIVPGRVIVLLPEGDGVFAPVGVQVRRRALRASLQKLRSLPAPTCWGPACPCSFAAGLRLEHGHSAPCLPPPALPSSISGNAAREGHRKGTRGRVSMGAKSLLQRKDPEASKVRWWPERARPNACPLRDARPL